MKPEKPKAAKAPAKLTPTSAKAKLPPPLPPKPVHSKAPAKLAAKVTAKTKSASLPPPLPTVKAKTPAKIPAKAKAATVTTKPVAKKTVVAKTVATIKAAVSALTKRQPAKKAPAKNPFAKVAAKAALTPPPPLVIPSILLEGDAPEAPRQSGPGERYALGSVEPFMASDSAELPEAYGTQRLLIVARDPHWLYAHWDMTAEQLRKHNTASRDGHLVLRVFRNEMVGAPLVEQHVHPESRNWFIHVGRGATKYVAQLGLYTRKGVWTIVATSAATLTPPDVLSDDTSVRFETIPVEVPFKQLLGLVKGAVAEHTPLIEVIQQLRALGHTELPELETLASALATPAGTRPSAHWTPEQERALAAIINIDEVRRVWMGSLEITELIRRSLEKELSSQSAAAFGRGDQSGAAQLPGGITSVSSPFGGEGARKGFWFNVNAELIIYGATEPDAAVTIGGRKIQLRKDGTFSFRFALPDGNYDLPVQATSADGSDSRRAELEFRRATQYRGDVGRHPQDKKLKAPRVENVG